MDNQTFCNLIAGATNKDQLVQIIKQVKAMGDTVPGTTDQTQCNNLAEMLTQGYYNWTGEHL